MNWIYEPWPWYVSGFLIALVMLLLLLLGKRFGMSSNFRTLCALSGGSKYCKFFNFNWRTEIWGLLVVFGALIGGYIAANFMSQAQMPELNPKTLEALSSLNIASENAYLPNELFSFEALSNVKTWVLLVVGGLLVGFGSRYAGGCTSGHAISGLSNLQRPSLIAVIGFFIGGLIMVHLIYPLIF